MALNFEPITPALGAIVRIAPQDAIANGVPGQLLDALQRYKVLLFPKIHMSDEIFLKLTAAMGEKHEVAATDDGSEVSGKGIFRIARDKDDKTQREFILGNDFWHMDGMNYAVPVKATLLKCEKAPAEGGWSAEAAAVVSEACFGELAGPVRRVCGMRTGIPYGTELEKAVVPNDEWIMAAVRDILN